LAIVAISLIGAAAYVWILQRTVIKVFVPDRSA